MRRRGHARDGLTTSRLDPAAALSNWQSGTESAPTHRLTTLKGWSSLYGWQDRLQAIADAQVSEVVLAEGARIRELMETGFALTDERVGVLKELADTLLADLRDPANDGYAT
jgi:hypothetical protein